MKITYDDLYAIVIKVLVEDFKKTNRNTYTRHRLKI